MALEDLNFQIDADIVDAQNSIRELNSDLRRTFESVEGVSGAFKHIDPSSASAAGSAIGGGLQLASMATQITLMSKLRTTMLSVNNTMAASGQSALAHASAMDRFRLGLMAPKVDPSLNKLPGLIDTISSHVASSINTLRGFGDATIDGIPKTLSAIAGAMGNVMGSGDTLQATVSKVASSFELKRQALDRVAKIYPTTGTAVEFLKNAMDVIAPAAEKVAQKVDAANDKVREAAVSARNLAFVAGGAFQQTGTSADVYARGAYHALLPTRLMMFEMRFAQGSLNLMRRGYLMLTHPIHAVAVAMAKSKGEFREMRATLPQLTGGLQLGTRTMRAFAHATFFAGPPLTMAGKAITATGRGLWSLAGYARSATGSIARMTGVQNTAIGRMFGMKKATDDTAASMAKLDRQSGAAGRGISGLSSKFGMAKMAAAGLMVGMVAMGTNAAMATEKNNAVFGTMLHSMGQGQAVVKSLQQTQAAKFFDNQELLDSGRLLFKAGVGAADLAAKTDQFAKIAAATSTELGDLTRIYQQGANAGSFGQDKINQYAERGIAIYDGLRAATGKSGAELQKMISSGQIGVAEMDAAFAHLTDGHGIYSESLTNLGNTTYGKFQEIKNNITQALGSVMGVALELLAPVGTAMVMLSQQIKTAFEQFRPSIMYAAVSVGWFFGNFVDLAKFAFLSFASISVTGFNDFIYFFTDTLPAYLGWFGENWKEVFTDAGNLVMTVFTNMGKNIGSAMKAIWSYIASGGTQELKFAFVPLLDGFKATVSELPTVPERAMTELERSLQQQTETLGANLANSFDSMLAQAQTQVAVEVDTIANTKANGVEDGAAEAGDAAATAARNAAENKAVSVRSNEGQSVVASFLRGFQQNSETKTQTEAAVSTAKSLANIEREQRRGKPIGSRRLA